MEYELHISTLVWWASEKNYIVDFGEDGDNTICSESKIIAIDNEQPLKRQLICLLHECGHVLVYENGSVPDFKFLRASNDDDVESRYRVNRVLEEAEAWKRGLSLAKRLLIPIDEEEWEEEKVDALQKYINWASN